MSKVRRHIPKSDVGQLRDEVEQLRKAVLSLEAYVRVPNVPKEEPPPPPPIFTDQRIVLQAIARTQEEVKELRTQLFRLSKLIIKTIIGHIDPDPRELEQIQKDTKAYVKSPFIKSGFIQRTEEDV